MQTIRRDGKSLCAEYRKEVANQSNVAAYMAPDHGREVKAVKELCYGINQCPSWALKLPSVSGCLFVFSENSYHFAEAYCKQRQGNLLFWTKIIFIWDKSDRQYSSWINPSGYWSRQLFGDLNETTCIKITRPSSRYFWRTEANPCSDQHAHFICQELSSCMVEAACPTGFKLSPDKQHCVRAIDAPKMQNSIETVCEHAELYLYEYVYRHSSGFIRDILPLDPTLFFWVSFSHNGAKTRFTKYEPYQRNIEDLDKTTDSDLCAQVNILLAETVKNEHCSSIAGGICAMPSIRCGVSQVDQRLEKIVSPQPETRNLVGRKVQVKRASCPVGWMKADGPDYFTLYHDKIIWSAARHQCRLVDGDLLDFTPKFSSEWELFNDKCFHTWIFVSNLL
ncbi:hypothetical protein RRG08_022709 [Elysia crispata]|uniref:C-type lectin domain-containing protein n=1 Tax=Elysia crispata TaxID=231223 RepID=A0AAE0ZE85_9GAST|nr:hypothetical protein RRG08_022709 [Elysia crispata]